MSPEAGSTRALPAGGVGALRRLLAHERPARPDEACEMCAAAIAGEHSHVVNLESRNLLCTCRGCWMLFTNPGAAQGRYRAVPERYLRVPSFVLSERAWDELQIPVRLTFFFANSSLGRVVAFYPSPAGATESELPLGVWDEWLRANPVLATLVPDVEALLVYGRTDETGFQCCVVPIDACYELTGLVRQRWRGFDGGAQAWEAIAEFFERLRRRSREIASPEDV